MDTTRKIVTLFSIKPLGCLHVDDARIAIISWLWASKYNGRMILRVDDLNIHSKSSIQPILDDLDYLGVEYDGPYFQSDRLDNYRSAANKLLSGGYAYPFPDTIARSPVRGQLRNVGVEASKAVMMEDRAALRFRQPEDQIFSFHDYVGGKKSWSSELLDDAEIISEFNEPSEMFASVVDDIDMGVTAVIQKNDQLSDVAMQIAYQYGMNKIESINYAHIPIMADKNNNILPRSKNYSSDNQYETLLTKLGCDEGYATNPFYISYYRALGTHPSAVTNVLATAGWKDYKCKATMPSLIRFDLHFMRWQSDDHPVFSPSNIFEMSRKYMSAMPIEKIANKCIPIMQKSGLLSDCISLEEFLHVMGILDFHREDMSVFADALNFDFFYRRPIFDVKAYSTIKQFHLQSNINPYKEFLEQHTSWDAHTLSDNTQEWCIENGVALNDLMMIVHLALTGRREMGSFDVMHRLGKDESLERISSFIEGSVTSKHRE